MRNQKFQMWLVLTLAGILSSRAHSQTPQAAVVFYTPGTVLSTATPFTKHGVLSGSIFDGDQALFRFAGHGFDKNQHHFIKIALPAGPHNFAASYTKDAKNDVHVPITLAAGNTYFFRANARIEGMALIPGGAVKGILEPVTCDIAHKELGDAKALIPRSILPSLEPTLDSNAPLPACQ